MPKGILKFKLPEDEHEFDSAIHAQDLISFINDVDNLFRSHLKYDVNKQWNTNTVEDIREKFWELTETNNINNIINK